MCGYIHTTTLMIVEIDYTSILMRRLTLYDVVTLFHTGMHSVFGKGHDMHSFLFLVFCERN